MSDGLKVTYTTYFEAFLESLEEIIHDGREAGEGCTTLDAIEELIENERFGDGA